MEFSTPAEPLSTDEAMNLGTKLLGEALLYGVSASFLLYEYNRSLKKWKDQERREKVWNRKTSKRNTRTPLDNRRSKTTNAWITGQKFDFRNKLMVLS